MRRTDAWSMTPLLIAGVFLTLAVGPRQSATAATVSFNAERRDGVIQIQASAMLNADVGTAWRVLTDYPRYVEFIPNLRVSRVLAHSGTNVTVEETGEATLGLFRIPLEVTFEIIELAPNTLRSRAVAGSLRSLESVYELTPVSAGVRLDYNGRVDPGFDLLGPIEQLAAEHNIARQFQALADEIERSSTAVAVRRAEAP
jgi:hypothetical protein